MSMHLLHPLRSRLLSATLVIGSVVAPAAVAHAAEQDESPASTIATADEALARLGDALACRDDAAYYAISQALSDIHYKEQPDPAFAGWKEVEQDNAFVYEFALPRPVEAFGHETQRVLLAGSGLMAMLPGADRDSLVAQLQLTRAGFPSTGHIYTREIDRTEVGEGAFAMTQVIRLTVSTITTHPDVTLAGCEYALEER
ncbi:hypothetical protein [Lysobacter sp.]|uniref:hypothetical protein n=1 Tax=Lysobacter sp. TaxID=72226 RepID=UPI002D36C4AB|nr:hypothetical protein [Lysobacter sp.]HZX76084.1 hypothetical protein [Lysobacter sp.]